VVEELARVRQTAAEIATCVREISQAHQHAQVGCAQALALDQGAHLILAEHGEVAAVHSKRMLVPAGCPGKIPRLLVFLRGRNQAMEMRDIHAHPGLAVEPNVA
jgi:hypothetical protein